MTTRPGALESSGMPSTRTHVNWTLVPPPPLCTLRILAAVVEQVKSLDLVTGHSCA